MFLPHGHRTALRLCTLNITHHPALLLSEMCPTPMPASTAHHPLSGIPHILPRDIP